MSADLTRIEPDCAVRLNAEAVRDGDCPVEAARDTRRVPFGGRVIPAGVQAEAAARRLWERASAAAPSGDAHAVTDRVLAELERGLRRWVGAEGFSALLRRATALTLPAHPSLAAIEDLGANPPKKKVVASPSDDDIRDAVIALLCALMALLGRIIGVEMAMRLVEQLGQTSPRSVVSIKPEVTRDE